MKKVRKKREIEFCCWCASVLKRISTVWFISRSMNNKGQVVFKQKISGSNELRVVNGGVVSGGDGGVVCLSDALFNKLLKK